MTAWSSIQLWPKHRWGFLLAAAVLLGASASSAWAESTPRASMRKGLKELKRNSYSNAVESLEKTVLEFPEIGHYNLGIALYRLGEYETAARHFNEALRTDDLTLQAKAYYNRGNALLAQTTGLTGPEQIGLAAKLAFEASDMYEKALLLNPGDVDAKMNFERAQRLRLKMETTLGVWYFDQAEELLQTYQAKGARTHYLQAKKQFERVLEHIDPEHAESADYLQRITQQLNMLEQAVASTEERLQAALQMISDYQYATAARKLIVDDDAQRYAFDLKPDLKKRYEETVQKNGEVVKIIEELSDLNIAQ